MEIYRARYSTNTVENDTPVSIIKPTAGMLLSF